MTVIDCSAMIELLAAKTQTGDAIARRVTATQTPYAPYVLDGEVISALLGLIHGQKISEREADAALSTCRAFPVERHARYLRRRHESFALTALTALGLFGAPVHEPAYGRSARSLCPTTVRNIANSARPASARVSSAVTESTVLQTVAVALGKVL